MLPHFIPALYTVGALDSPIQAPLLCPMHPKPALFRHAHAVCFDAHQITACMQCPCNASPVFSAMLSGTLKQYGQKVHTRGPAEHSWHMKARNQQAQKGADVASIPMRPLYWSVMALHALTHTHTLDLVKSDQFGTIMQK